MGIFAVCFGGMSSAAVQPLPAAEGGMTGGVPIPTTDPENAEALIGMLTQAQQMELQSAFRQFDINGNGTMCAAATAIRKLGRSAPTPHARALRLIWPFWNSGG